MLRVDGLIGLQWKYVIHGALSCFLTQFCGVANGDVVVSSFVHEESKAK